MYDSPLFWEHGVFLQPQHFQVSTLQLRYALAGMMGVLNPYMRGVSRLKVNEDLLSTGLFEVVHLELLLASGEWALIPENADLPPRQFSELWTMPEVPLPVWIGLAGFREQGGSAARAQNPGEAPERCRYRAVPNPEQVPDLLGSGPAADIEVMRFNMRLCFGDEGKDLPRIPIARLVHDGNRILLDPAFVPPCVDINVSPVLRTLLRNTRDMILSRSRQLEDYKIAASDVAGAGTASPDSSLQGIMLFSVLGVLARSAPLLDMALSAPSLHPWPAYAMLIQLAGELSVFSPSFSPLGETALGERAVPPYDHDNLAACFSATCEVITRIVDTLVIGPAWSFILEQTTPGMFSACMPRDACSAGNAYWLLLRSSLADIGSLVRSVGKLSPSRALSTIVGRALPGVRLLQSEQPPAGLPHRQDTAYFLIDGSDGLWQRVLDNGEVSLFLPGAPEDLLAQIAVIQR